MNQFRYSETETNQSKRIQSSLPNRNQQIANSLTQIIENKMFNFLDRGDVSINPRHQTLDTNRQQRTNLSQLNVKKHKLQKELEMLDHLIQSDKFKPMKAINSSLFTAEHHQEVVSKIKRQKKLSDQRREAYIKELKEKREDDQSQQKIRLEAQRNQNNSHKRIRIEEEIQRKKKKKKLQKSLSLQKPFQDRKLLYRQLEDRYIKEVVLPAIQERNSSLKKIKSLRRPIRIDEIRKHEEQYLRRREEMSSSSLLKKEEFKYYEPSFKSSRYELMRKQEEDSRRQEEQEKTAALNSRIQRVEEFKRYVANNFKPVISLKKKAQLQKKMEEQISKPRSNSTNIYQKGGEYLTYSKSKGKKDQNPQTVTRVDIPLDYPKLRPNSNKPNYISSHSPIPNRVQKVQSILKSLIPVENKRAHLKIQTQILDEIIDSREKQSKIKELKDKSDNSELYVASIKARIGMLQLSQN